MQKSPIRTILLDLGGVILDLDINKSVDAFNLLGWNKDDPENNGFNNHSFFSDLEVGIDTPQQFRDKLRPFLPNVTNDQQLDDAWNAMLAGFPADNIDYLKELRSKYNLYLLSNTNEIHVNHFCSMFSRKFGYSFSTLFIKTFYSHQMGLKKPDLAIFKAVLNTKGINAEETLFIDDSEANTIAAAQMGIQTLHIQAGSLLKTLPGFLEQGKEKFGEI